MLTLTGRGRGFYPRPLPAVAGLTRKKALTVSGQGLA